MTVVLTLLAVITLYYLVSLSFQIVRFLLRKREADRSSVVSFSMVVAEGTSMEDRLSYLSVLTPFYDEEEKSLSFSFSPKGFRLLCVPYVPFGLFLLEQFAGDHVVSLSRNQRGVKIASGPNGTVVVYPPGAGTDHETIRRLFTPGDDLVMFIPREISGQTVSELAVKTADIPEMSERVRKAFVLADPDAVLRKEGDQWILALKEKGRRKAIIDALLRMAGTRVLGKSAVEGRLAPFTLADEILEAGPRRWKITASLEGGKVRLEGISTRLDDWEEANWFLRTVDTIPSGH